MTWNWIGMHFSSKRIPKVSDWGFKRVLILFGYERRKNRTELVHIFNKSFQVCSLVRFWPTVLMRYLLEILTNFVNSSCHIFYEIRSLWELRWHNLFTSQVAFNFKKKHKNVNFDAQFLCSILVVATLP